ncbi:glycosyltransferase family 4 protein [Mucilaginibacter angelicae]|uniref:Glycosyltransferase family 4 protein n=1 Tax=Mucilaginibacter angelicae TaxID=869718 RepID=A0ABV6LA54_9SPHI
MNEMITNPKLPFVYFGRLAASKGIALCIEAAYILYLRWGNHGHSLWIIGGNNDEIMKLKQSEILGNKISDLELQGLLFWWGHLPHEFLPLILRKCAFFCFTSQYEPGGRTILEAMASGLPVIAAPQGFAETLIEPGVNGLIIADYHPETWAEAMQGLLANEEQRKAMGQAARQTILNNYTMQAFMERHWEIYDQFNPEYNKRP